ncbi:MAG: hypothetical protein IJB29_05390 [Mailhella sp.]|nr:hypothetical protein [Mailhella sp.]
MPPSSPIPALEFIPHRPPIVFIDGVIGAEGLSASSVFRVPESSPYLDEDGRLMPEAMLEVMAQCFAAGAGMQAAEQGQRISWGYLAAVKDLRVLASVFSGDELHAEAVHSMTVGPLHVLDCRVTRGKDEVASAQLKIFVPEE